MLKNNSSKASSFEKTFAVLSGKGNMKSKTKIPDMAGHEEEGNRLKPSHEVNGAMALNQANLSETVETRNNTSSHSFTQPSQPGESGEQPRARSASPRGASSSRYPLRNRQGEAAELEETGQELAIRQPRKQINPRKKLAFNLHSATGEA